MSKLGYIKSPSGYWLSPGDGYTSVKARAHLYTEEYYRSLDAPEWNFEPAVHGEFNPVIDELCGPMGKSEKVILRQKTSAERKAEPIHSAPMSYHPDALAAHARLCVSGNIKHNGPGAPLSWVRGKSNDHLDCAARHMLTPDAIDPETGETELTAAFWRLGCALQLQQERLLAEKGIMPYSRIVPTETKDGGETPKGR